MPELPNTNSPNISNNPNNSNNFNMPGGNKNNPFEKKDYDVLDPEAKLKSTQKKTAADVVNDIKEKAEKARKNCIKNKRYYFSYRSLWCTNYFNYYCYYWNYKFFLNYTWFNNE